MALVDLQPRKRRGVFGTAWWLLDGLRRTVLNLLFLVLLVAAVASVWMWARQGTPALADKTTLVIDLSGPLRDQAVGSARDQALKQVKGEDTSQVLLRDLITALDAATTDPKITGALLLTDDFQGAGLPLMNEAAAAINRFRKTSGKKVSAWASHYDQRAYYLAALTADEVFMHPMGSVIIQGYGSLRNYYKDAFDRLGVSANVIRVGKYKSFGEPYFANGPSKETLEADGLLYGALWTRYTGAVEQARKLPAGALARMIDELPRSVPAVAGNLATLAVQAKLVDGLKTRDELRALLTQRGAADDDIKSFRQISLGAYLARQKAPRSDGDAVGVIVAQGGISDGNEGPGAIGGRSTSELIRQARNDKTIKAVVLRVNSPGGSAFGSELIRRELELTRAAGKPVVVSMGDVAASGGYWISTSADEVIADASTITGSIGVFAMLPTAPGLVDKFSVHVDGPGTTWLVNAYDPRKALDPRFAALVQSAIGHTYDDFLARAAKARQRTPEQIHEVAQGRVWTGEQARERGLVDRLGNYADALNAAATRAKLATGYPVRYVEKAGGRLSRLLAMLGGTQLGQALATEWADALGPAHASMPLAGAGALGWAQALMPGWQDDLAWLQPLTAQRAPFAAVVHCLCTPP